MSEAEAPLDADKITFTGTAGPMVVPTLEERVTELEKRREFLEMHIQRSAERILYLLGALEAIARADGIPARVRGMAQNALDADKGRRT